MTRKVLSPQHRWHKSVFVGAIVGVGALLALGIFGIACARTQGEPPKEQGLAASDQAAATPTSEYHGKNVTVYTFQMSGYHYARAIGPFLDSQVGFRCTGGGSFQGPHPDTIFVVLCYDDAIPAESVTVP